MGVLFRKLKKANKILLSIYIITTILYLVSYILIVKSLVSLSGIETTIRIVVIIVFVLWLFIYLFWNLINLILKKKITIIVTSFISIIFIIIFFMGSHYIDIVYSSIKGTGESKYITYTSNLVILNDGKIDENSKLGMINSSQEIEGNVLAKELIKNEKLKNEVIEYSSYYELIYDLLNKQIDGAFLSSNYQSIFSEDDFAGLKDTKVLYSYSKEMENADTNIVSNKNISEAFTLLLMGVDSMQDGLNANAAFNGDTLMMITFNPKTLNATMFSIPRDTYVPIACNNNRYAKINSSAARGTSCVIDTVEQFTGIKIDYYVKINFKGVVQLVDALDGITLEIEKPDFDTYQGRVCEQNSDRKFGDKLVCIDPGIQTINGEQALAYSRCRHLFIRSDIDRNRHQQQVVEAIAKKGASLSTLANFEEILNTVSNNIATNMPTKQILNFYDVIKSMLVNVLNDNGALSIQKTYLEYYSLPVKLSQNGNVTSAIGHYPGSLEAIVNLMKVNLELEEEKLVKSFTFDANENYTTPLTGKNILSGDKLETMPNFVGKSVSEVDAWATRKNIELKKEFVQSDNSNYNSSVAPGLVANQSVAARILLNNVKSLTIYINDGSAPQKPIQNEPDNNIDLPDVINPLE